MQETRIRRLRARVANACDICKLRKIKCCGSTPCQYCVRRQQPDECRYSAQRRRPRHGDLSRVTSFSEGSTVVLAPAASTTPSEPTVDMGSVSSCTIVRGGTGDGDEAEHDETEVPREARLLRDPNGKLIFVGDCAPLSFFQTVRRLVTSLVDSHAFAPETSAYSALENANAPSRPPAAPPTPKAPHIDLDVKAVVSAYLESSVGLVDIFDNGHLQREILDWSQTWAGINTTDVASAVNYLVLAIGSQESDERTAQGFFDHARDITFASLSGNLGVDTIQALTLVTLYMLNARQINGAFLFFGIAVRAAYSIGIHRTAVNSRFGPEAHRQRDRLWKSLRVVDLFLSTSMGRPPATSDTDCTIVYRGTEVDGRETFDLLNAAVQIFVITETIVVEVYSRRKISPRLTDGISCELREWSTRWLQPLKDAVAGSQSSDFPGTRNGACRVLSSYYYAVILVSRPFLMVELRHRLSDGWRADRVSGKAKLADACIDAAILMLEPIQSLIEGGVMTRCAPVIVSWLFASSLVLGLGLLGGFGRILEKHCRASILSLEYFGKVDGHAMQYSLIARSLLTTALDHLEKREAEERAKRTESSVQIFGLVPQARPGMARGRAHQPQQGEELTLLGIRKEAGSVEGTDQFEDRSPHFNLHFEASMFELAESVSMTPEFSSLSGSFGIDGDQALGSMNLFPLLENTEGHIDLANYF